MPVRAQRELMLTKDQGSLHIESVILNVLKTLDNKKKEDPSKQCEQMV